MKRFQVNQLGVVILVGLSLSGCAPALVTQQSLRDRVHKATTACVALPTGPAKAKLCAAALLCQTTAQGAATATQAAQTATAAGATDVAKEAEAAGKNVLADLACKRGGW